MKSCRFFKTSALALFLCLLLNACSNEKSGTGKPNVATEITIPSTQENGSDSGNDKADSTEIETEVEDDSYEITYELYFSDLTLWNGHFLKIQESFATTIEAFTADYENPENVQNFADGLKEMNEVFAKIDLVRPHKDMAELHQNLVDSCGNLTATVEKMIAVLEDDFVNRGQEALDEYNVLFTMEYLDNFNDLALSLTAVVEEWNLKFQVK